MYGVVTLNDFPRKPSNCGARSPVEVNRGDREDASGDGTGEAPRGEFATRLREHRYRRSDRKQREQRGESDTLVAPDSLVFGHARRFRRAELSSFYSAVVGK